MALKLYAKDVLIGTLTDSEEEMDWPRFYFTFESTPEYARFRDVLDMNGSKMATESQMLAARRLELRTVSEEGAEVRWEFVFLDENARTATIRQGFAILDDEE